MQFPERLKQLPEYTFDRLRKLLDDHEPGGQVINFSVGEPRHPFPEWIFDDIKSSYSDFGRYPPNYGIQDLRVAISQWVKRRYNIEIDPDTRIIAVNGTREALFSACIALCPEQKCGRQSHVLIPNPFYQVYAGATAAANAVPVYVNAEKENGFLPNYASLDESILRCTAIAYYCSPSNPQGSVASLKYLQDLINLAEKYDFTILADECYSEIYRNNPPSGALEALVATGASEERVLVFNSLSKRSSLPGLRSGFVIGGMRTIVQFKKYRSYNEPSLTVPLQKAATKAWRDEIHVEANRSLYCQKYELADSLFEGFHGYTSPEAGLFLWLDVGDGEQTSLNLWKETGVRTVPGSFFTNGDRTNNPGAKYIRVAMVTDEKDLRPGLNIIRQFMEVHGGSYNGFSS